jgi:iron complex transport system permease protein
MKSEWRYALGWPLVSMLAAVAIAPWFGAEIVWPGTLRDQAELDIFVRFRLTRTLLGLLAGASLSVAGCLFQALLRNPLASEYTLGVSTSAALGAVFAIFFDLAWVWTGSVIGALLGLALIGSVFLGQRRITTTGLILAGVSVNSVCSAMIILLQSASGFSKSFAVTTWLFGALDAFTPKALGIYAAVCLPLAAWAIAKAPDWDLLSMGESWAAGRGVPVRSLLWQACLAGSLLTAATVALAGPIGFVGLMVPHIVRRFAGASHRRLLPSCFFFGAAFLICCDAVARTLLRPAEIPVGVLTAILGGPGLIWILRSARSEG